MKRNCSSSRRTCTGRTRVHRLRNRSGHPGGRGHGPARQHLDHLRQRRQRRQREGMLNGTPNEFTTFNGVAEPSRISSSGTSSGDRNGAPFRTLRLRCMALDTAFQVDEAGGVAPRRDRSGGGHVVARPHDDAGGIHRQFHHLIDIAPTILEATGIPLPDTLNGTACPMDGVSMVYTWDKANADAPSPAHHAIFRRVLGNRAIYHDGWVACTTPATLPWELSSAPPPDVITGYKWEPLQRRGGSHRVQRPGCQNAGEGQADAGHLLCRGEEVDVLPLDNTTSGAANAPKPNLTAGRTVFTYSGGLLSVPNSGVRTS